MKPPPDITVRLAPWGEARVLHPLHGGHRNIALRVQINGKDYVAKSTRHSEASLRWVARLQYIAQQTGLHLPPYLPNRYGNYRSAGWTLEPFLNGVPGTYADLHQIAPFIQRLHRFAQKMPKRPGMATSQNLTRLGLPQTLRARLAMRVHAHLGVPKHTAIHADLTPANLLRLSSGQIALLDWDEARKDDPHFDLAALDHANTPARQIMEIATGWQSEPAYARRLLYKA